MNTLSAVTLEGGDRAAPTPEVEQERKVAIFDLLEENLFEPTLANADQLVGPYALNISVVDNRLVLDIQGTNDAPAQQVILSLTPLKQSIKDYFQICEAYFEAVKNLPPGKIEAIDMGRRGIHDEGARMLAERLDGKITVDHDTARRLFTLIAVIHFKA